MSSCTEPKALLLRADCRESENTEDIPMEPKEGNHIRKFWVVISLTAFFLLLLLLLLARAMSRDLNRDEEQFISAGALLARNGYFRILTIPISTCPISPTYTRRFLLKAIISCSRDARSTSCAHGLRCC